MIRKRNLILMLLLISIIGSANAKEVFLPPSLHVNCFDERKQIDNMWEKTLILIFPAKRRIISTNTGIIMAKAIANHSAHPGFWDKAQDRNRADHEKTAMAYLDYTNKEIAKKCRCKTSEISILGTAADLDNMSVVTKEFAPLVVTTIVTAGARGNALRAGTDEGEYIEGVKTDKKNSLKPGTINIIVLTNIKLTDSALARSIITVTEAKTAALEKLKVKSSQHPNEQATGTGTDSVIVVSGESAPTATYTGGHSKIGELIGKAVYEAVIESLKKQNGFESESSVNP